MLNACLSSLAIRGNPWDNRTEAGRRETLVLRIPPILIRAAKRVALDPRVRGKAAEVFEREVKPRAKNAWQQAKPKLDAAKDELKDIARESDPRKNPRGFAAKVKERFADRARSWRSRS